MTPSGLHAPPRPAGASANIVGNPPPISIRLSLPPAKKPRDLLFGDQNGYRAPSVPASGCAVVESSGRSKRRSAPLSEPIITIRRPSGDMANEAGSDVGAVMMSRRVSGASTGSAWRKYSTETAASKTTAAHAARSRKRDAAGAAEWTCGTHSATVPRRLSRSSLALVPVAAAIASMGVMPHGVYAAIWSWLPIPSPVPSVPNPMTMPAS